MDNLNKIINLIKLTGVLLISGNKFLDLIKSNLG